MVTASHLPGAMNGFKLCREKAIPLSGDHGLPALERLVTEKLPPQQRDSSGVSYQKLDLSGKYIEKLSSFVCNPGPLKVLVDAGNGMAGPEVSALFKRFPVWTLIPMYMEPDGRFPHHIANPLLPSATRELQAMVVKEKVDIGVAFDGDADRCGFIDERGDRMPEDLVTALIAEFLLTKESGAMILYDLHSSRIVPETIVHLGEKAVQTQVGHAFIKGNLCSVLRSSICNPSPNLANNPTKVIKFKGFSDEVKSSFLQAPVGIFHCGIPGDNDYFSCWTPFFDPLQDLLAIHLLHL
jgi:phosphomannomutase